MKNTDIPITSPSNAPPRMSLGKWTYRYNHEKAINIARGIATMTKRWLVLVRIVAAMVAERVCPEGKVIILKIQGILSLIFQCVGVIWLVLFR